MATTDTTETAPAPPVPTAPPATPVQSNGHAPAVAVATPQEAVSAPATAAPPARRGGRRGVILVVVAVVLCAGGWFPFNYIRDGQLFVSTDDALVDSNLVAISSPSGGTLTTWRVQPGDPVYAGQVIGIVRLAPTGGGAAPLINIKAPQDGTVLKVDGKEGQVIGAAQAIAYMADLSTLRITAYIDEGEIRRLRAGQQVEVTVDGTGGQVYQGTVSEIIPAAASQFALIQSQDRGSGNFTKVTQRLEVHIDIGNTDASTLYPGMNARVKIAVA